MARSLSGSARRLISISSSMCPAPASSAGRGSLDENFTSLSQGSSDDFLHDLVGPTIDALYARIPPAPSDLVLVHVPVAAMELQAAVQHTPLQFGRPILRSGR